MKRSTIYLIIGIAIAAVIGFFLYKKYGKKTTVTSAPGYAALPGMPTTIQPANVPPREILANQFTTAVIEEPVQTGGGSTRRNSIAAFAGLNTGAGTNSTPPQLTIG